jgi:Trp operon repressor
MLVKSTNLANARFMDFYQVMSLVIGFLSKEDLIMLNVAQEANDFRTVFDLFEKAIKQAQKTGITDALILADDERDNVYTGFTGSLRSMTRFPDAIIAQSATKLLLITDKYGEGVARLPQREETGVLKNIIAELRTNENTILLQNTGLFIWLDKLEQANNQFDTLYVNRTEKESEFISGLTRTERANMQTAFEKLVRAIEANAYLKGEAAYKSLAEKINTEVANVQQAAKSRATLNAKTKTETK